MVYRDTLLTQCKYQNPICFTKYTIVILPSHCAEEEKIRYSKRDKKKGE